MTLLLRILSDLAICIFYINQMDIKTHPYKSIKLNQHWMIMCALLNYSFNKNLLNESKFVLGQGEPDTKAN